MPVSIRKVGNRFRVSTPHGVKAKRTTKEKAERQKRLLNAIDHGFKPTRRHESMSLINQITGKIQEEEDESFTIEGLDFPITIKKDETGIEVAYGDDISKGLSRTSAAVAIGQAVLHAMEAAGKLD